MGKYLNDVLAVSILEFYLPERKGGPQGGPLRCIYKKKKKKNFFFKTIIPPPPLQCFFGRLAHVFDLLVPAIINPYSIIVLEF